MNQMVNNSVMMDYVSLGIVTKINSNIFTVKVNDKYIECSSRGIFKNREIKPIVGDNVKVNLKDNRIEEVLTRKNYLLRPNVANIDIALIVTSIKEPDISLLLLDKLISIVEINKIEPVIILTKTDLVNDSEKKELKVLFNYYNKIGIKTFINTDIKNIKKYLDSKIVTVCGQTGAGKSTLINLLKPELNLNTNAISTALGRGIHTTRIVELFEIDNFYIVDTPGFSQIDINIYSKEQVKMSFREFRNIKCKFNDCNHLDNEYGCEVKKLVENNTILKSRYDNYLSFIKEII